MEARDLLMGVTARERGSVSYCISHTMGRSEGGVGCRVRSAAAACASSARAEDRGLNEVICGGLSLPGPWSYTVTHFRPRSTTGVPYAWAELCVRLPGWKVCLLR